MTVSKKILESAEFIGDGVITDLPFNFGFIDDSDIILYEKVDGFFIASSLTFTVRDDGNESGTVLLTIPLASLLVVKVVRETTLTQEESISTHGAFYPEVLEKALDKVTMLAQEQNAEPTLDMSSSEIKSAYQAEVPLISQADAEAGIATVIQSWSSLRVLQAVVANSYRATMVLDKTGAVDITGALKDYITAGGSYYVPEGDYLIDGAGLATHGVVTSQSKSVDIICHPNAVFHGGSSGNNLDGTIITIAVDGTATAEIAAGIHIGWKGGKFNMEYVKGSTSMPYTSYWPAANLGTNTICDALNIRGEYSAAPIKNGFGKVVVTGVKFWSGEHWETAGGDSHVFVNGAEETYIYENVFTGARDAAVYCSGGTDNTLEGRSAFIFNNKFVNCFQDVALKRGYKEHSIYGNQCKNSAISMYLSDLIAITDKGIITDNQFINCGLCIRLDNCEGTTVTNNTSYDTGWKDSAGVIPAAGLVHTGSEFRDALVVYADATSNCVITGNKAIGINSGYNKTTDPSRVVVMKNTCISNFVSDNIGIGIYSPVFEEVSCVANKFLNNRGINTIIQSVYESISSTRDYRKDVRQRFESPTDSELDLVVTDIPSSIAWAMRFKGLDSANTEQEYASIRGTVVNSTTGAINATVRHEIAGDRIFQLSSDRLTYYYPLHDKNGDQILTTQQTPVADAVASGVDVVLVVNRILSRLRNHGLIAT